MSKKKEPYCGSKSVPKNKVRGTMKECADSNQVRYWGVKKIDKKFLGDQKEKVVDVENEIIKLKNMEAEGGILLKEIKKTKLIIKLRKEGNKKYKIYQKKLQSLLLKRDKFIIKYNKQREYVKELTALSNIQKTGKKVVVPRKSVLKLIDTLDENSDSF